MPGTKDIRSAQKREPLAGLFFAISTVTGLNLDQFLFATCAAEVAEVKTPLPPTVTAAVKAWENQRLRRDKQTSPGEGVMRGVSPAVRWAYHGYSAGGTIGEGCGIPASS